MATVYFGRLLGAGGFKRIVAIKRLHPHLAQDPAFAPMLLDEARLAGRVRHPNVIQMLDVEARGGELFIVMEYVHGVSLSHLLQAMRAEDSAVPLKIAAAIVSGVLHGLHAAHEAQGEDGEPLALVHRDVSPQNILVGADGVARVLDFGIAKATDRLQTTRDGQIKGKLAYMAAEQLCGEAVDRRADIYAAGVVLWETLTGQRLFGGETEAITLKRILEGTVPRPRSVLPNIPPEVEEVTLRALAVDPARRFETARQMALALERGSPLATPSEVGEWVEMTCGRMLRERAAAVRSIEARSSNEVVEISDIVVTDGTLSGGNTETDVVTPTTNRPPRSAARLSTTLLGLGAVVVIAGAAFVVSRPNRGQNPASVGTASASPDETTSAVSASAASASASAAVSPPSAPSSSGSAVATASPSVSASAGRPVVNAVGGAATARGRGRRGAEHPNVASQCDPPYTVDAQGVRHYKPQCPLE